MDVHLRVYDLSEGKAALISPLLMRKPIRGIWHSSIEVFSFEYYFGGYIEKLPPETVEQEIGVKPDLVKRLGQTHKTKRQFEKFLRHVDHDFTPETYNLVHWNCNHFTDLCSRFLLQGKGIPRCIVAQPLRVQESMVGRAVLKLVQVAQDGTNPFTGDENRLRRPASHTRESYRPAELRQLDRTADHNAPGLMTVAAGAVVQASLLRRPLPSPSVSQRIQDSLTALNDKVLRVFTTCSGFDDTPGRERRCMSTPSTSAGPSSVSSYSFSKRA